MKNFIVLFLSLSFLSTQAYAWGDGNTQDINDAGGSVLWELGLLSDISAVTPDEREALLIALQNIVKKASALSLQLDAEQRAQLATDFMAQGIAAGFDMPVEKLPKIYYGSWEEADVFEYWITLNYKIGGQGRTFSCNSTNWD